MARRARMTLRLHKAGAAAEVNSCGGLIPGRRILHVGPQVCRPDRVAVLVLDRKYDLSGDADPDMRRGAGGCIAALGHPRVAELAMEDV